MSASKVESVAGCAGGGGGAASEQAVVGARAVPLAEAARASTWAPAATGPTTGADGGRRRQRRDDRLGGRLAREHERRLRCDDGRDGGLLYSQESRVRRVESGAARRKDDRGAGFGQRAGRVDERFLATGGWPLPQEQSGREDQKGDAARYKERAEQSAGMDGLLSRW